MGEDLSPQAVLPALQEIMRTRPKGPTADHEDTRSLVVVPVLRAIGWSGRIDNEYRLWTREGCDPEQVDIALTSKPPRARPWALVEVKPIGDSRTLSDADRWQLAGYALAAGTVRWAVLTNGLDWEVYDMFARAPLRERRFLQVDLRRPGLRNAKEMLLLSPESISEGRLADRAEHGKAKHTGPQVPLVSLSAGAKGILEPVVRWLWDQKALTRAVCPIPMEGPALMGPKRLIVNTEPRHSARTPFKKELKIAEHLYVETAFTRLQAIRAARIVLRECGYTPDSVTVTFD